MVSSFKEKAPNDYTRLVYVLTANAFVPGYGAQDRV